jgi:hypothetical protein
MSNAEVMRLLAEQQAKSSDMMMAMMKQTTNNNSQQLEIPQAEETRKREVHEQKLGIANQISGMAKCLQPQSFKDFTHTKLSDVTISKLSTYLDQVMVFLETVEPQSAGINT